MMRSVERNGVRGEILDRLLELNDEAKVNFGGPREFFESLGRAILLLETALHGDEKDYVRKNLEGREIEGLDDQGMCFALWDLCEKFRCIGCSTVCDAWVVDELDEAARSFGDEADEGGLWRREYEGKWRWRLLDAVDQVRNLIDGLYSGQDADDNIYTAQAVLNVRLRGEATVVACDLYEGKGVWRKVDLDPMAPAERHAAVASDILGEALKYMEGRDLAYSDEVVHGLLLSVREFLEEKKK